MLWGACGLVERREWTSLSYLLTYNAALSSIARRQNGWVQHEVRTTENFGRLFGGVRKWEEM
jgi:hypothetical protein